MVEAIDAERDAYFTSLPVRTSPAFRRVLITAISRTRASPDGELDVTDLLLVLAQDREIPVLRRLDLDEATVRRAIRDATRP